MSLFQGRKHFQCKLSPDLIIVDEHDRPLALATEEEALRVLNSCHFMPIYQPIYKDGKVELQIAKFVKRGHSAPP